MSATQSVAKSRPASDSRELDGRLETIGWACFLILLGGIWLVPFPSERILEAAFLVGVGLIMLGLNAARAAGGIHMRGFTTLLGAFALISGLAAFAGLALPFWPVLLILIGAYLILRSLVWR